MKYSKFEFWIATGFFIQMLYVGLQSGFSSVGHYPNSYTFENDRELTPEQWIKQLEAALKDGAGQEQLL